MASAIFLPDYDYDCGCYFVKKLDYDYDNSEKNGNRYGNRVRLHISVGTVGFRVLRNFLIFKTIFEEIKTKPDLEKKIHSNIDHRQSLVFLFYFKVPHRVLICFIMSFHS